MKGICRLRIPGGLIKASQLMELASIAKDIVIFTNNDSE